MLDGLTKWSSKYEEWQKHWKSWGIEMGGRSWLPKLKNTAHDRFEPLSRSQSRFAVNIYMWL